MESAHSTPGTTQHGIWVYHGELDEVLRAVWSTALVEQHLQSSAIMATHSAVAITAVRQPLSLVQVPTLVPGERELKIKVEWANASPLALHQADGGLMVKPPQIIGSSAGGVVVEVGPGVKYFKVGDRVSVRL